MNKELSAYSGRDQPREAVKSETTRARALRAGGSWAWAKSSTRRRGETERLAEEDDLLLCSSRLRCSSSSATPGEASHQRPASPRSSADLRASALVFLPRTITRQFCAERQDSGKSFVRKTRSRRFVAPRHQEKLGVDKNDRGILCSWCRLGGVLCFFLEWPT